MLIRKHKNITLTRARKKLFLFIQDLGEESLLQTAKNRSAIQHRNTSIFTKPEDKHEKFQPQKGVFVRSKVEYIIYKALERRGLQFKYEQLLELPHQRFNIKPDFTIKLADGTVFYWEHLVMLDSKTYYQNWQKRKQDYEKIGVIDKLITTDDLDGIDEEKITKIIESIKEGTLVKSPSSKFSLYHTTLN
ncbi:hypothetical protein [Neobacillus sp. Marseille-QA0830]